MTADEWDRSNRLDDLLGQAGGSARKLLLFNAACARRVAAVMPDDSARGLIDLTERRADGLVGDAEWGETLAAVLDQYLGNESAKDGAAGATFGVLMELYRPEPEASLKVAGSVVEARAYLAYVGGYPTAVGPDEWVRRAAFAESQALCGLCRCLFGNPFRPVTGQAAWRTSTVGALAQGIYADRAFDRLPILADALQDAGCDNLDVLAHCRADGPHTRGCWVVDMVLGLS
ncbi:MAG: hypothetical protein JWO38_2915 [Gemmataceae bacterium]|nr:hypothetical protein [Gemmataceae bacterium]